MTKRSGTAAGKKEVREAKAVARQSIGKLIGDDAEVREGRAEQKRAERSAPDKTRDEQE